MKAGLFVLLFGIAGTASQAEPVFSCATEEGNFFYKIDVSVGTITFRNNEPLSFIEAPPALFDFQEPTSLTTIALGVVNIAMPDHIKLNQLVSASSKTQRAL